MDKQTLALVSLGLTAVGFASYIPSVLRRHTRPHVFSWLLWAVLVGIAFFAQRDKGAGYGAWTTGFSAFMCLMVALLSFRHGEKDITRGDWVAFVGGVLALPVWAVTHDAFWAIVIVTLIDLVAYYPTVRKAYHKPFEENYVVYMTDTLKWVPALMALDHVSLATLFFQMFSLVENGSVAALILWRRRIVSQRAPVA